MNEPTALRSASVRGAPDLPQPFFSTSDEDPSLPPSLRAGGGGSFGGGAGPSASTHLPTPSTSLFREAGIARSFAVFLLHSCKSFITVVMLGHARGLDAVGYRVGLAVAELKREASQTYKAGGKVSECLNS